MTCEQCDAPTTNGRYCSRSCSATSNNLKRARPCGFCGEPIRNRSKRQKFCSRPCYFEDRYQRVIEAWLAGEIEGGSWAGVSNHVKRWLRERDGDRCTKCGWAEVNPTTGKVPVQTDHIDGNPYNHRPENLRLLCPNCHSLTPTYGALNTGKGRKERVG